ncbi:MAG TPA: hypothetical protein VNE39_04720 [Planctomycetota bacterium]|nr:hypothetical protein [Planctomycetota bacterium]
MRCGRALVWAVVLGVGCLWAGEEAAPKKEAVTPEQLREALKGFKGFLAGDVVKREKAGAVLYVRSITLIEGNQAKAAGIALGQHVPVQYATEKDEKGNERPKKSLTGLLQNLEKFPVFMVGGPAGGNVMIAMGDAGAGGGLQAQRVVVQGGAMKMNVNGAQIQIGGGGEEGQGNEKVEPPKGPQATLRVKASEDGTLVADRAVPGMQPAGTWDGMPNVQFEAAQALEMVPEPVEPKKEKGKDSQF